ncbi:two-component system response regulator [Elusimicrobiota bacterium]
MFNINWKKVKKKILVIDDEAIITSLIKDSLEFSGYGVITANSGAEGLRRAKKYIPDLILLDIRMPLIGGIEVLRRLKQDSITKNIPVVVISIVADKYRIDAMRLGAEYSFMKPLDFAFFNRKIPELLN